MSSFAPKAELTAAVWNWIPYYKKVVKSVMNHTWKSTSDWPGLAQGIVGLAPFGKMVPQALRDKVDAAKARIIAGKLKVFAGPLQDRKGDLKIKAGSHATDKQLLGMTWFVKGVVGTTE